MTKKILVLSTFILLIIGCSTTVNPDEYLRRMNITLQGDYEIMKRNSSPAIGDLLIEFELKLGEADYNNVVNTIKLSREFEVLDSHDSYPSGLGNLSSTDIKEFACFRNGTYYKHLYIPDTIGSGWETYNVFLKNDSILYFQYVDE